MPREHIRRRSSVQAFRSETRWCGPYCFVYCVDDAPPSQDRTTLLGIRRCSLVSVAVLSGFRYVAAGPPILWNISPSFARFASFNVRPARISVPLLLALARQYNERRAARYRTPCSGQEPRRQNLLPSRSCHRFRASVRPSGV